MTKRGPWTVEATAEKFHNAFMTVKEDEVIQPDGKPGSYATVAMKPGVSVLPMAADGTVYLTRQFRYAVARESLEVASGSLEEGEDPHAGAQREVREELGIEADEWVSLGHMDMDTSIVHNEVHLFLARGVTFTETEREGTETIKTMKLPLAEAVQKVMDSEITHGPSCVLLLKAAHYLKL